MKEVIHLPAGTSSFDLVIAVLKMLQTDYGAVVTDVDVVADCMQFDLRLPADQRLLQLKARRHLLQLASQRSRERLDWCRQVRQAIEKQRVELARQRMWIAKTLRRTEILPA